MSTGTTARHRIREVVRRPEAAIALAGLLVAAWNIWWVHRNRFSGGLDVDETGYIAAALRYHRLLGHPKDLAVEILSSTTGPLVPILSVPLVLVGGRSALVAQALQPLLHAVTAVAVCGITARLTNRRTALVAGVVALTLPTALVQDRSYQFATGASAFTCLAVWALLASDRCRRLGPMVLFGAATGAMLLSRTMTVGFVPALALAAIWWCRRDRRAVVTIGAAAATTFLVAGIWWLQGWDGIMGYLRRSGYSRFSRYWGSSGFLGRFPDRWDHLMVDIRAPYLALALGALLLVALDAVGWRLVGGRIRTWPGARRELAVIWIVILGGYAALFSTANAGTWFDTPLQFLAVAGIASMVGSLEAAPGHVPPRRWVLGAAGLAIAAATVVAALPDSHGQQQYDYPANRLGLFYGGVDRIQAGDIGADPRFASPDIGTRAAAAKAWREANVDAVRILHRYEAAPGTLVQAVTGSAHLVNTNTLLLASEEERLGIADIEIPVTFEPDEVLRRWIGPRDGSGRARIIVRIRSRSLRFPDDRFPARYDRLLRRSGWRAHERVRLPDGGYVEVLTHPSSDPLRG